MSTSSAQYISENFSKEEYQFLINGAVSGNSFYASLAQQLASKGYLSEKQAACIHNGFAKSQAPVRPVAERPTLDQIQQLFGKALESGLKRPIVRAVGFRISLAPLSGKNAGCLYVKEDKAEGEYFGKIDAHGAFFGVRTCPSEVEARLSDLNKNPLETLQQYGRETGNCACCGRELTDPESVARGIGPVCAEKFGV